MTAGVRLPEVVVAVPTYRRNDQIAALIPLVSAQIRAAERLCDARLVVIDNDTESGAERVVGTALAGIDVRADYVAETRPGLVAARNRALAEAGGADALVFIDDDEQPGADWLAQLVSQWRSTGAWAVTGPVRSVFTTPPSEWIRGSGLFDRDRDTTGAARRSAATNNLLLDLNHVRRAGLRFDERFSATGGEDAFFMHNLGAAGGNIIWCDEAEVSETVPANRSTRAWVLRRSMRAGESWARVRLLMTRTRRRRVRVGLGFLVRGSALLLVHSASAMVAGLRGNEFARGRAQARAAGGLGIVRAVLGRNYAEYRR